MSEPLVEVIIPTHDPARDVNRAISSITLGNRHSSVAVTVVAHDIPREAVRLDDSVAKDVRVVEFRDGVHSPAGPKNFAIESARGRYLSFIDSDDQVEPGAILSWTERAIEARAAALIPPERHARGAKIRTPPVRVGRRSALDPVKDRLAYRTAPLGIIERRVIIEHGLRFGAGLATGEDLEFGLRLWFSGETIVYGRGLPHYVVGDDAGSRASTSARPLELEFRAIADLVAGSWFASRSQLERTAIAIKLVRVHLFGSARDASGWSVDDRAVLRDLLATLEHAAPGLTKPLSIADARLYRALADPDSTADHIVDLARRRRRFGRPPTVITRSLGGQFSREGPLRFMAASALL